MMRMRERSSGAPQSLYGQALLKCAMKLSPVCDVGFDLNNGINTFGEQQAEFVPRADGIRMTRCANYAVD